MIEKDQTFTLEDQKGLTNRQARDAQLGREFILRNLAAGHQPAIEDRGSDLVGHVQHNRLALDRFHLLKTPWTLRRVQRNTTTSGLDTSAGVAIIPRIESKIK